ncbi:hypothetical protein CDIK_2429 [Cucumispora dikerogammari]|nr:hypothetical protein CDIK_2429 [Cucumispora dikerogammari]
MFLFTYILISKQILSAEGNREELERQLNKTVRLLDLEKQLFYNTEPLCKFTKAIINRFQPEDNRRIKYHLNKNNIKAKNLVKFSFIKFSKSLNKIYEKILKSNSIIINVLSNILRFEQNIFTMYMVLNYFFKYELEQKKQNLIILKNFFLLWSEDVQKYIEQYKTVDGILDGFAEAILNDWFFSHSYVFNKAILKPQNGNKKTEKKWKKIIKLSMLKNKKASH